MFSSTSTGSSRSQRQHQHQYQHQSAGQTGQISPSPRHPQRRRLSNPDPNDTNVNTRRGSSYHHINIHHSHPSFLEPPFSYSRNRPSSPRHHSTSRRLSNPGSQTTSPYKAPTPGPSAAARATTLQLVDDSIPAVWPPDDGVDDDIILPRLRPPVESLANDLGWSADALDHFYTSSDGVPNHLSDFAGQDFSSPSTYPRFTTTSHIPPRDIEDSSAFVQHHYQSYPATSIHPEGQLPLARLDTSTPNSASTSTSNLSNPSTHTLTTATFDSHFSASTATLDTLVDFDTMPPRTRRSSLLLAEAIVLDSDQHVNKRQRTAEQPPRGLKREPQSQPKYSSTPHDDPFADLEEEGVDGTKRENGEEPLMIDLTETPAVAKDEKPPGEPEEDHRTKLGAFQCVICMDNVINLTVTHCGHLFCAQCLHSSLHVDTLNKGKCPMCRTKIDMKPRESYNSKTKGVWPLELKLMTARRKGKRKADGMA